MFLGSNFEEGTFVCLVFQLLENTKAGTVFRSKWAEIFNNLGSDRCEKGELGSFSLACPPCQACQLVPCPTPSILQAWTCKDK